MTEGKKGRVPGDGREPLEAPGSCQVGWELAHPYPASTCLYENARSPVERVYASSLLARGRARYVENLASPTRGPVLASASGRPSLRVLVHLGVLGHVRHSNNVTEGGDLRTRGISAPGGDWSLWSAMGVAKQDPRDTTAGSVSGGGYSAGIVTRGF